MDNRLRLHELLKSVGGPNVYYQTPTNVVIKYPAIKYNINKIENKHANNSVYHQDVSYLITVMSKDVDDDIVKKVSMLPKCSFDRRYIQDNIYHTTFIMYY